MIMHAHVTSPIVRDVFRQAVAIHGVPASTLTDILGGVSKMPTVVRPTR